jgi:hypothetical protein
MSIASRRLGMADVAGLITELIQAGTDPTLVGRVAAAFAEREAIPVLVRDEAAERRRQKDRDRKQLLCGNPRKSADSAEISPLMTNVPRPLKTLNPPPKTPLKGVKKVPRRAPGFLTDGSRRRAFGGTPRSEGSPEVGWSEKSSGLITSGAAKAAKTPPKSIGMQLGVIGA